MKEMILNDKGTASRGTTVDLEKCVEQSGGNRFKLVLEASAIARDIKKKNRHSPYREHRYPQITSLLKIQTDSSK